MTFIPVNLEEAEEQKPAPAGRYPLQITGCVEAKTGPNSKNPGSPQFKVSLGFTDQPNTPNITHYISLPGEGDEQDSMRFKMLLLRRFLTLFNVPYDPAGIDTERMAMDMVGATADVDVTLSEPTENGDVFNRIVVPKIRGEAAQAPGRKRSR
jgi:hypothetical protein